jgi:branched-chain amino acid transport system ATP-binding protein
VADEESIVGTENAGIIAVDVVAAEGEIPSRADDGQPQRDQPRGRHGSTETGTTEKDSQ